MMSSTFQPACLPVCLFSGCPTDWSSGNPAGWSVGRLACRTAGRSADLSARKVKGISSTPYRFRFWWQLVAASGREWLRSYHVFKGLNTLPLHPSGRAMLPARTAAPGSVFLLGSRRVSVARYLYGIVITGISPIRLLRISPETTLPLAGRGFLSEVGKPVFLPAVRLPEAALMP